MQSIHRLYTQGSASSCLEMNCITNNCMSKHPIYPFWCCHFDVILLVWILLLCTYNCSLINDSIIILCFYYYNDIAGKGLKVVHDNDYIYVDRNNHSMHILCCVLHVLNMQIHEIKRHYLCGWNIGCCSITITVNSMPTTNK